MRRQRHIVAALVVVAALSADRAIAAAPQARPQVQSLARTLATKLTSSFRQSVSTVQILPDRTEVAQTPPRQCFISHPAPLVHASQSTPFRFRLPPPTL